MLCVQKSRGLGMNGFSAFQFWMPHLLWASILYNMPGVTFDHKVLMPIIQLPRKLLGNILFCFALFLRICYPDNYDFLDHRGRIVGKIVFFSSRNIFPFKGTESRNYLRAVKSLKLQRLVSSRKLSRWGSVWHIYWLARVY